MKKLVLGIGVLLFLALVLPVAAESKIVFSSNRDAPVGTYADHEIYVMDDNGDNPIQLTFDSYDERNPVWSWDGTKIAFQYSMYGDFEIWTMDANGDNQIRLTEHTGTTNADVMPTWSPDGTKIAFSRAVEDVDPYEVNIFVMDANGDNQNQLTDDSKWNGRATWSPDGTKIVFGSTRDGGVSEIYMMDANGDNQIRLAEFPPLYEFPRLSWDGTKIAYVSYGPEGGSKEIFVMDANGDNPTRLTFNTADDGFPAWSPDGTKIVFQSDMDGDYEIYTINAADGSNLQQLTDNTVSDMDPHWGGVSISYTEVCGDNSCNGEETCSSCSEDCGACPVPQGPVAVPEFPTVALPVSLIIGLVGTVLLLMRTKEQ